MNSTITLTKVHNPLHRADRDVVQWAFDPNQSLEMLRREHLPEELEFSISLNGLIVPAEHGSNVFPRPGDCIVFMPVIAGGDDGKMIGRIVAMIAIAAVAGPMGASLATSMGFAGTGLAAGIGAAAVMMVGGLLVNALLPPPKPKLPTLGDDFGNSQSYSWNPQSIQQQGGAIPRWYGRNKLYGNVTGGYIRNVNGRGGDKQYLNALIDLGIGPYFAIDPTSIKVNDQLYSNFNGVTVQNRLGWLNQDILENFTETPVEHALSQKVTKSGGVVTYIPAGNAYDALEVEVSFPNGLFEIDRSTGTFMRTAVRILVELTGPSGNLVLSGEGRAIDFTLENKGGWSYGQWIPINTDAEIIDGSENPTKQYNVAWLEDFAGGPDYAPIGAEGPPEPPYHVEGASEDGGRKFWKFFAGEWNYYGGAYGPYPIITSLDTDYSYITAFDKKSYRKTWRISGLVHGTYTVKVTRLTDDNTSDYISNDSYLTKVTEIVAEPFTYPRHVLCGLNALATDQLSGSLRFSCIADCLYVRVWNGTTWSIEYNNNPAWVLFDVLTQPVYSGEPGTFAVVRYDGIDPARLDLPKFLEWAEWNDTLCPDGNGGTEKRMTFNGGFDSETNLWDAAMQICQVGGAALVWNGIKLTLAIDKPSEPVQMFTVGNTGQDSFSGTFLSMEDRAAEIECDFVNIEKDYSRDKLTVVNDNIKTITSKVNLPMFGITKPSEVWRLAKRRLAYNELISRSGSFIADIDAIACTVGDVIHLQSDVPQWGIGGRIVSATSTTVTLDQTVTIESGKTYSLMVRLLDDTLVEKTVSNAPGTTAILTLATSFSSIPVQYDVYAFGESGLTSKPVRVTGIQRSGDLQATIAWIEYNETIYDVDQGEPALPTVNYSALPLNVEVVDLTVSEQAPIDESGSVKRKLSVAWNVKDISIVKRFDIYVRIQGTPWYLAQSVIENAVILKDIEPSTTYDIVVLGVSTAGLSIPFNQAPSVSITTTAGTGAANTQLLAGVRGLQIFGQGNDNSFVGKDCRFIWNKISSTDISTVANGPAGVTTPDVWFRDYEVKIYDTDGNIRRTEYVTLEQYSYSFQKNYDDGLGRPVRSFKIEVRARDKYYNISKTPAILTVSNPAPDVVSGVTLTPFFKSYMVDFAPLTTPDIAYYIVYASTSSGFTPTENLIVNRGPDTRIIKDSSALTYYIKIAAVDSFGEDGLNYSPEYSVAVLGQLVTSADLVDGAVLTAKLAEAAVATSKLAAGAVDSSKLADLAVEAAKLADSAVTTTKIANAAVGSAAIANAAVGTAHIQNAAIQSALIGDAQVLTAKIQDAGITTAKIADLAVNAAKITDATITGAKIADATIGTAKIIDANISTAKIADAAITNAKIANLAVASAQIQDAAITNAKIDVLNANKVLFSDTTNGYIALGKSGYTDDSNAGFWLGNVSGGAKFNIGNSTDWLKWNGSKLDYTGLVNGTKSIQGRVATDLTHATGSVGFTATKQSAGYCRVTFNTPFAVGTIPISTANISSTATRFIAVYSSTNEYVDFYIIDMNAVASDTAFQFICIGVA